ncbi:hypothetical protein F2Q70_00038649 [Brassica cretica]|uniref:Uncharacterized protein n=1 Tax=Brassica cretica TaxID=69181 RepID=A0A8S9K5E4_BRACR|nr:hypothetical protein F2Q70_00038649 [Brassica cretica]
MPRMMRKTFRAMRFWRYIKAGEEGWYVPNNTRSNKETQLLFSTDLASLERSIRKGIPSSSIDDNTSSSLDSRQPPPTQTPVSSTDTRSPSLTKGTLPSIDIVHPTSIDSSVRI